MDHFPFLKIGNLLYGFRLFASVILALAIAYKLELENAFWAGITAAVVCQPTVGASLCKGRVRGLGTVAGAVAIVLLTAIFPQDRICLLAGLALWIAACGYFATILPNFASYGAALAGFTAAVIFADVIDSPQEAFVLAATRTAEIWIGILSVRAIAIVADFGDARLRLAHAFARMANAITSGLADTLANDPVRGRLRSLRRELIRNTTQLEPVMDEAAAEGADLYYRFGILQGAIEGLFSASSAWAAIADHLDRTQDGDAGHDAQALLPAALNVARADWLRDPKSARQACDAAAEHILAMPASDPSTRFELAEAFLSLRRVANGLILLVAPGSEQPDTGSHWPKVPDFLPGLVNGLRSLLAVAGAEAFWVEADWAAGQAVVTFAAVAVTVYSPDGEKAYKSALRYCVGTVIGAALALIVNFAILPGQHGFPGFSLGLACVLVPFGAISGGPWQKPMFSALVINFLAILSPLNQPSYDLGQFLNSALAVVAGTIIGALSMLIIPPVSPAWRASRLLALTLRDLRRLAVIRRWPSRAGWTALISRRLETMPKEATPRQLAQLVTALSVGEAIVQLRDSRLSLARREALDHALMSLAAADGTATQHWLSVFNDQRPSGEEPEAMAGQRAHAASAVITTALSRCPGFFECSTLPRFASRGSNEIRRS